MWRPIPRFRRPSGGTVIALVALAVAVGGGGGYVAVAAGTVNAAKFLGPGDFKPGDSGIQYGGIGIGSLVCLGSPFTEGPAAAFDVPVDLPDGARISKVVYYYTDNNATADMGFHLSATTVVNNQALADDLVNAVYSSGTNPNATNIAITPTTPIAVDNAHQEVHLNVDIGQGGCFPPGERTDIDIFHGARVFYRK